MCALNTREEEMIDVEIQSRNTMFDSYQNSLLFEKQSFIDRMFESFLSFRLGLCEYLAGLLQHSDYQRLLPSQLRLVIR